MFLNFIGVNEKILNLSAVALIEDQTDKTPKVVVTTTDGAELEFEGTDAEIILNRAELFIQATDSAIAQMQGGQTQA